MADSLSSEQQNYFELFNLPSSFAVDSALLDEHYRALQSRVHPDRFVSASTSEQLNSMQLATLVNDAYRTLKNPTTRARYLLQLQGIETLEESNTAMPADFLMMQMEWRESAEDAESAGNIPALEQLLREMNLLAQSLIAELDTLLADQANSLMATDAVRKLSFIDKVRADVERSIEKLEV